jgi:hypothetical protein
MDKPLAEDAFFIEPEASGGFSWENNTLTFSPNTDLACNTAYTVAIATGARDLAGNPLTSGFSRTFSTVSSPSLRWVWFIIGIVIIDLILCFAVIMRRRT